MPTLLRNPLLLVFSLLSLFFFVTEVHGQATISSPASVTACLPQQLTVSGGEGPYTIQVLPGGSAGGEPLETLPQLDQAGSVRWVADVEPGQNVTFAVRDNTGAVNFSSEVPVLAGSSTDCIGANASNSGSATTGSAASTASSGASAASASSGASSVASSGSASARTTGSASSAFRSGTSTSASASVSQSGNSNDGSKVGVESGVALAAVALVAVLA
ncbi:hypothetical protein JCM8097_001358 [Rhodosporidiobolus ruineniae]